MTPNIIAEITAAYHTFFIAVIAAPIIAVFIIGIAAYLNSRGN